MYKTIRTGWMIAALVAVSLLFFGMMKMYYVPKADLDLMTLKADSLLSANLSLEKELRKSLEDQEKMQKENRRLSDNIYLLKLRPGNQGTIKSISLKKKLKEMTSMIRTYQSQMRSLILANEELEKQVQALSNELP